jgi:hypothetical protein
MIQSTKEEYYAAFHAYGDVVHATEEYLFEEGLENVRYTILVDALYDAALLNDKILNDRIDSFLNETLSDIVVASNDYLNRITQTAFLHIDFVKNNCEG